MDHRLSNRNTVRALPSAVKAVSFRKFSASFVPNSVENPPRRSRILRRGSLIVSAGPRNCESSSLKTPLKPRSEPGKYLSRVLQNQRQEFHIAVVEELKQLAIDQDAAVLRMNLSAGSDEASLHRRIAELHDSDCRTTLQDVMYMLIVFNFSEIKVHLLPKLTDCTINGRLHIWPAKDWELESIHNNSDALDMVRQHVYAVTGLTPQDSNHCRETSTQIQKRQLSDIYSSSIQYGYFLQSVSTRHRLEKTLSLSHLDRAKILSKSSLRTWPYGWNQLVFGESSKVRSTERLEKLSGYVVGFDSESLQRCGRVRSREAMGLIEKQRLALFGDGDEVVWASFSSLKRLVLEAVGFGSFLWDVEEYVDKVYKLSRD